MRSILFVQLPIDWIGAAVKIWQHFDNSVFEYVYISEIWQAIRSRDEWWPRIVILLAFDCWSQNCQLWISFCISGFLGILADQCQRTFEETPTNIWSSSSRGGLGAFLAEDRPISIMNPLSPASYLQTFSYKWLPWLLLIWIVCIFLFSIVNHQGWFPDMWIFFPWT